MRDGKTERVMVRFTKSDVRRLGRKALLDGVTKSAYVRQAVLWYMSESDRVHGIVDAKESSDDQ